MTTHHEIRRPPGTEHGPEGVFGFSTNPVGFEKVVADCGHAIPPNASPARPSDEEIQRVLKGTPNYGIEFPSTSETGSLGTRSLCLTGGIRIGVQRKHLQATLRVVASEMEREGSEKLSRGSAMKPG